MVRSFAVPWAVNWASTPLADRCPPCGVITPPSFQYGYRCAGLKCGMITAIARTDPATPHSTSRPPAHAQVAAPARCRRRPAPPWPGGYPGLPRRAGGCARPGAGRRRHHDQADRGDRQPLVLLDQDQRQRPQGGGARVPAATSADSEKASSGTANAISWKSKTIICCRPHENPYAAPIARPVPVPSRSCGRPADRHHRQRGQQRLRDQQRHRGREEPEERGDQRHDGLEVVTEQVEARAPDRHHRRLQMGELPDVLGVDAQVPGTGVQAQVPEDRDRGVGGEGGQRDEPDHRVGPAEAGPPLRAARGSRGQRLLLARIQCRRGGRRRGGRGQRHRFRRTRRPPSAGRCPPVPPGKPNQVRSAAGG